MKAKYQFQCLITGLTEFATFQDKKELTIEEQARCYLSHNWEIIDYRYY